VHTVNTPPANADDINTLIALRARTSTATAPAATDVLNTSFIKAWCDQAIKAQKADGLDYVSAGQANFAGARRGPHSPPSPAWARSICRQCPQQLCDKRQADVRGATWPPTTWTFYRLLARPLAQPATDICRSAVRQPVPREGSFLAGPASPDRLLSTIGD
jgi:hypothetical protein